MGNRRGIPAPTKLGDLSEFSTCGPAQPKLIFTEKAETNTFCVNRTFVKFVCQ